ncbi:benzoate 4-monooxygenase cytochrome P450 [Metarhizium album ARSEF 1941]|uniref:Benzoate 4-monooxygenase cytochrome P450 n=1 Tax=Metarhizium album (strain ARSEF 1941) TaxID=1081103 RepID=A0A0B2WZ41_METAS|nr:benzoate 4-monooxygenase cytochrome P450 [Metarhizium album ARSEF 1941]KHN98702.1 benzoate 4-monooxygenase cytochrome P450 [Metarhizium album ARSEF 1941]
MQMAIAIAQGGFDTVEPKRNPGQESLSTGGGPSFQTGDVSVSFIQRHQFDTSEELETVFVADLAFTQAHLPTDPIKDAPLRKHLDTGAQETCLGYRTEPGPMARMRTTRARRHGEDAAGEARGASSFCGRVRHEALRQAPCLCSRQSQLCSWPRPSQPTNVVSAFAACSWPLLGGLDAILACTDATERSDALCPSRRDLEIRPRRKNRSRLGCLRRCFRAPPHLGMDAIMVVSRDRIDPYRDSSFSTIDDRLHSVIRNKLMPSHGDKDVDNLHRHIDEQVANLARLIDTEDVSTGPSRYKGVDLAQKVQYFALDVISTLALGRTLGHLAEDQDKFRYIETENQTVCILVSTTLIPGVIRVLQSPYFKWVMPRIGDMAGIGNVINHPIDDAVSHDLATSIRASAGRDGPGNQAGAHLVSHLRRRGTRAPIPPGGHARRPAHVPTRAALYPEVSSRDEVLCGVPAPAGANVAWSPQSVMRDQDIFGSEADLFRPERWLDRTQKSKPREQSVMMAFASGSRRESLGRNIAMTELNKIYVEVSNTKVVACEWHGGWLSNQETDRPGGPASWAPRLYAAGPQESMEVVPCRTVLFSQTDFSVRITRRASC